MTPQEHKTVFVPSSFGTVHQRTTVKVPTGETKRGFFGGEKEVMRNEQQMIDTGEPSDCEINGESLASDLEQALNALAADGYTIVAVVPVTSGGHACEANTHTFGPGYLTNGGGSSGGGGWGYGWGYGYSFTSGVIVHAVRG